MLPTITKIASGKSYRISNEFSRLKEFTLGVHEKFDLGGEILRGNRNVVKKIITPDGEFVIKSFKGMYFLNRLAYSLFRKSKAERSYRYSARLNDNGILTPPHVAWIDCYTWGFLTHSYFVSVYCPYKTLHQFLETSEESDKKSLYRQLAAFTLKMHRLGIYHDDFSVGNILVHAEGDDFKFSLVDLNRVKFQKINYKKGLQNFKTLKIPPQDMNILLREYAIQSDRSPQHSINTFWIHQKRSSLLRAFRKRIRYYTVTPLERMLAGKYF
ncbi:MAG TPA: lipopolysaccharide kinase InaA family protein [Ohtaekwangia sp.]|nr:lipopolysaccharide kinase InaA family protein [Ohtaekwangia sp.]